MTRFDLGVVVPTYNEKGNIEVLLPKIKQVCQTANLKTLVLVMDDNSPDGTVDLVRKLIGQLNSENFEIRCEVRPKKMGLASAYIQGFEQIRGETEFVLSMDADLSHDPIYTPEFIKTAKSGYDYVIGSRYIQGGGVIGWGLYRRFISRMGSLYATLITGVDIRDFTGGFNLYRSSLFDTLSLGKVKAEGYLFQIEMKYRLAKLGFKYKEFPIVFTDRVVGQSKISRRIVMEAFLGVVKLRLTKIE
jgi:dolichol-phosphate mannosyltransferase